MWAVVVITVLSAFVLFMFGLVMRIDDLETRLKATEIQVRSLSGQTNGRVHF